MNKINKSIKVDISIQISGLMKNELNLIAPIIKEPWREFTLNEIKKISKNKSHHYVFEALKKFCQLNILNEKKVGNTNAYSLNYKNNPNIILMALAEAIIKEKRVDIPYNNMAKITEKIKNPFYSLLITGSYAEKKQTAKSDLDIVIIIPDSESKKEYQIALKEGELIFPEIHGYIFTKEEFYQMLINEEFNYGKETARKHIIFYGGEQYYKILFEAMKHGFKG